jgi:hypothetical protein
MGGNAPVTRISEADYANILRKRDRPQRTTATMPAPSEHDEQCAVIAWADAMRSRYPELAFLHHSPNGFARNKAVASQIKRAGCRAGFPDLVLLCARGGWHGLAIELKTAKGHTSPMQDVWLENLRNEGYFVSVCRSANEAIGVLENYLRMGA